MLPLLFCYVLPLTHSHSLSLRYPALFPPSPFDIKMLSDDFELSMNKQIPLRTILISKVASIRNNMTLNSHKETLVKLENYKCKKFCRKGPWVPSQRAAIYLFDLKTFFGYFLSLPVSTAANFEPSNLGWRVICSTTVFPWNPYWRGRIRGCIHNIPFSS